jgi:hypothetical protein
MDHPFDRLSIKDGQLVLKTPTGSAPYMDTELVEIVRKAKAEVVDERRPQLLDDRLPVRRHQ